MSRLWLLAMMGVGCADRALPLPEAPAAADLAEPARDLASSDHARDLAEGDSLDLGSPDLARGDLASSDGPASSCAPIVYRRPYALVDVAAGDFDGDGHADFVTASQPIDAPFWRLELYRGRGDGSFFPPEATVLARAPSALAAADLDGDGKADLVVLETDLADYGGANRVSLRRWRGQFVEEWGADLAAPVHFLPASVISLNLVAGSGGLDLVVAGAGAIQVFPAIADGTAFGAPISTATGEPIGVAVGDFDGDAREDVITNEGGSLLLRPGSGDGRFGAPKTLAQQIGNVESLMAVDYDYDQKLDLVLDRQAPQPGTLLMRGHGDGSFDAPVALSPHASFAHARQATDLDLGGPTDLIGADDGTATFVLYGDGNGGFTEETLDESGRDLPSIALADFNQDGHIDLIVTRRRDAGLTLLLSGGGGYVAHPLSYGDFPLSPRLADVDGDGRLDLLTVDSWGREVVLRRGLGGGALGEAEEIPFGAYDRPVLTVGDVDGDGWPDLLVDGSVSTDEPLLLLRGAGGGSFAAAQPIEAGYARVSCAGDFDGDGRLDLLAQKDDGRNTAVLLGDGQGHFTAGPSFSLRYPVCGDFDGDGHLDLFGNAPGPSLLRGVGDGSFASPEPLDPMLQGAQPMDLDGDGRPELLAQASASQFAAWIGGKLVISDVPALTSPSAWVAGDLDGDGRADLVTLTADQNSQARVTWWRGGGDGRFSVGGELGSTVEAASRLQLGDLDGNGRPRLVVIEPYENAVALFPSCW